MKKETLEDIAERMVKNHPDFEAEGMSEYQNGRFNGIIEGAKWQQERSYSEEDMRKAFHEGHNVCRCVTDYSDEAMECFEKWFEQFNKKQL